MKLRFCLIAASFGLAIGVHSAETTQVKTPPPAPPPAPKPKPQFQYQTDGVEVSIPTADEPKVKAFNAETIRAAAKYLDNGAICWVREKTCVNCHTTGPYMSERPALSSLLGNPSAEVLQDFIKGAPAQITPQKETEKDG